MGVRSGKGTERVDRDCEEWCDLVRSARELEAAFQVIPDAVVFTGTDRRITKVNRKFVEMTGYSKDEVVGRQTGFLYAEPEKFRKMGQERYNVAAKDNPEPYRITYRRRDGTTFVGETTGIHVRDTEGQTLGYLGITRDVTDVIELEEARREAVDRRRRTERMLRETSEMAGVGGGEYDHRSGRLTWSDALFRIHDLPVGQTPTLEEAMAFFEPEARVLLRQAFEEALEFGTPFEFELPMTTAERRRRWVRIVGKPMVEDGDIVGVRGFHRDLTEEKQAEEAKREFVSVISHELRTPLTSIRGGLSLVDSGVTGDLPDEAAELVHSALKSSERLAEMVDDILDIEKIESGAIEFNLREESPARLLEEVVGENTFYHAERGVSVRVVEAPDDVAIVVDPDKFHRILTNLLSNAVKYSPDGGEVTIAARPSTPGTVRVIVRDCGPGIPESLHATLFDRFTQADCSLTREREGTGLGLHIARELTGRMGGEIGFETAEGEGTTMFVDFPTEKAS